MKVTGGVVIVGGFELTGLPRMKSSSIGKVILKTLPVPVPALPFVISVKSFVFSTIGKKLAWVPAPPLMTL